MATTTQADYFDGRASIEDQQSSGAQEDFAISYCPTSNDDIYPFFYWQNLVEIISEFYEVSLKQNEILSELVVGQPWVAPYEVDGKFYRGILTSINQNFAKVLFVDYGNRQRTRIEKILAINSNFLKFLPLPTDENIEYRELLPFLDLFKSIVKKN